MATNDDPKAAMGVNQPPSFPDPQLDVSEKIDHDRLRAIAEARRAVREIRESAVVNQLDGTTSRGEADLILREALESYLLEIKQYRNCDETARAYWDGSRDNSIGRVTVEPPADDRFVDCEPVTVAEIRGLNDILYSPVYFSHTFTTTHKPRHRPPSELEETVTKPIGRPVLQAALEWANAYVHYIGLDLKLEKSVDADAAPY